MLPCCCSNGRRVGKSAVWLWPKVARVDMDHRKPHQNETGLKNACTQYSVVLGASIYPWHVHLLSEDGNPYISLVWCNPLSAQPLTSVVQQESLVCASGLAAGSTFLVLVSSGKPFCQIPRFADPGPAHQKIRVHILKIVDASLPTPSELPI